MSQENSGGGGYSKVFSVSFVKVKDSGVAVDLVNLELLQEGGKGVEIKDDLDLIFISKEINDLCIILGRAD